MAKRRWVTVIVKWEVRDRDGFVAMATEMAEASRAEPGTLIYDWYIDEATGTGGLLEMYASKEALDAHIAGAVFSDIAPRHRGVAKAIAVEMFGAHGMERSEILRAPTTWWGEPIAAVTD
ncbi:MAG: putative quinol monooxygenase [Ilumatobacteraceae bacterium]